MKKSLSYLLSFAVTAGFVASAGRVFADETGNETSQTEITQTFSGPVETLDYLISAKTSDGQVLCNFVDGLVDTDKYGHLIPGLATEWEQNEDATVWTFKLREGVKWVTSEGEEFATVKADDFVTALRHAAEFGSEMNPIMQGVVKGYSEYLQSDFSDEAFESVGVKAVDEMTVQYTLENPTPYFDSMANYLILYPINRDFLESKGEGCKLGSPDKENCQFGAVEFDSILYNGAYIFTDNTEKSKRVFEKNESYWDAENVLIEKITEIYDDGKDPYSVIKGFEAGTYLSASLNPSWEDYETYKEKYKDYVRYSLPNSSCFGIVFNFNRQSFNETNYAEDEAERAKTHNAIMNENFRKALRAATDKKAKLAVSQPDDLAESSIRNINGFPDAGSLSDGTSYFAEVTKQYNEMTGEERDLDDGHDAFFNADEAKSYIEAAKGEGVEFPVHLDMLVVENSDRLVKEAQSFKKSVEDSTDGQIVIELVMRDVDTVQNIAYRSSDPAAMDYDISTFTGWGPDYADPKTFVDIWSPITGYYMHASGLGTVDESGEVADKEIKEAVGMMEYQKYYEEADKITNDHDARMTAFAKADAFLVSKCFYIPTQMQSRGVIISKLKPFQTPYAACGISGHRFKGAKVADHIITTEEYNEAYDDFQANR
ncbi:MAG: peptide ABC transporter substrate-binding protein [Eubacteriales bacterium]|nr:peptide ABC transporter substrate-binding protein [Eubacteriales bacterium]